MTVSYSNLLHKKSRDSALGNTTALCQGTHCIIDVGLRKPGVTITGLGSQILDLKLILNTTFVGEQFCQPFEDMRDSIEASFGFQGQETVVPIEPHG